MATVRFGTTPTRRVCVSFRIVPDELYSYSYMNVGLDEVDDWDWYEDDADD